jgi:hypothetical protein
MNDRRYVARSPEIAARLFEGEMLIMSARDSTIFTLSEVATVIWKAADGSTPLDEIVATRVCAEFDVAPEVALEDAEHLVRALASHGLLVISDQPIGRADSDDRAEKGRGSQSGSRVGVEDDRGPQGGCGTGVEDRVAEVTEEDEKEAT